MTSIEEEAKVCQDALNVLLDGVQLCKLLKGECESCSFTSLCGELFTKVAMLHLCAPSAEESIAWKCIKPAIDAGEVTSLSIGNNCGLSHQPESATDENIHISPLSDSPLLRSLDTNEFDVHESMDRVIKAKDEELLTLHRKLHKLEEQLSEIKKTSSAHADSPSSGQIAVQTIKKSSTVNADSPSSAGQISVQTTAAASLQKHGVPILSATTMDLDFSDGRKISLGRGVFSEVYLTTMNVAVKAITGRFSQQRLQQFRQEAEALHLVQGPARIIRFFGICIDSLPNLFLITEVADAGSLERLLASNEVISFPKAMSLAISIAEAMDHVHQKRVLHRDLKPSNCMLTQYDTIKLIDFGLARVLTDDNLPSEKLDGAGTPTYQAPEVLACEEVGYKSDVYSFALIMWELMSRKIPFEELSLEAMRACVIAGERPPIEDSWDSDWVFIMTQCWDNIPKTRPSFLQIQRDLREISNSNSVSSPLTSNVVLEEASLLDPSGSSPYRAVEEL